MFSEIRNNYIFGPGVDGATGSDDENGLFAGIAIDAWRTDDSDEAGTVVAQVLMSKHGDVIVSWYDNGARLNREVLAAIERAKTELKTAWGESHTRERYIQIHDGQGAMDVIRVHNYDESFRPVLNAVYDEWFRTQSDDHHELYHMLRARGYQFDVVPVDVAVLDR